MHLQINGMPVAFKYVRPEKIVCILSADIERGIYLLYDICNTTLFKPAAHILSFERPWLSQMAGSTDLQAI